jgi:hypothetical protein
MPQASHYWCEPMCRIGRLAATRPEPPAVAHRPMGADTADTGASRTYRVGGLLASRSAPHAIAQREPRAPARRRWCVGQVPGWWFVGDRAVRGGLALAGDSREWAGDRWCVGQVPGWWFVGDRAVRGGLALAGDSREWAGDRWCVGQVPGRWLAGDRAVCGGAALAGDSHLSGQTITGAWDMRRIGGLPDDRAIRGGTHCPATATQAGTPSLSAGHMRRTAEPLSPG